MFTPNHWVITASVQNPLTNLAVIIAQIECQDRLQAQTLLAELREASDQLAELLPADAARFVYGGMEYATEEG